MLRCEQRTLPTSPISCPPPPPPPPDNTTHPTSPVPNPQPTPVGPIPNIPSPPSHLCFHIIFTFPATVPLFFRPFLGHFNGNLPAKSPHVPPLFPNFFSHPTPHSPVLPRSPSVIRHPSPPIPSALPFRTFRLFRAYRGPNPSTTKRSHQPARTCPPPPAFSSTTIQPPARQRKFVGFWIRCIQNSLYSKFVVVFSFLPGAWGRTKGRTAVRPYRLGF